MKSANLLFFLGWRNVARYRNRTLQTFLVLFLGSFSIMVVDAFMQGYRESSVRRIVMEQGHMDIHGAGYLESSGGMPLDKSVPSLEAAAALVVGSAQPALKEGTTLVLAPSIETGCLVSDGSESRAALVLATEYFVHPSSGGVRINPLLEGASRSLTEGRFPAAGERGGAILDERIASKLNVRAGDEIILTGTDAFGSFSMASAPVLALAREDSLPGGFGCVVGISDFAPAFGLEDQCTKLTVWAALEDGTVIPSGNAGANAYHAVSDALGAGQSALGAEIEVRPFEKISAGSEAMFDFLDFFLSGMLAVFAVVAIVGITNAILLSVQDRTRDIGTLRAIALTSGQSSILVYVETLIIGLLASACALAAASAVVAVLVKTGAGIRFELSDLGTALPDSIMPALFPMRLAAAAAFSAVFPLAAAVLPARRVRRLTIRECLAI